MTHQGVALVRPPGPRLGEGTYTATRPVDTELAARQHAAFVAALAGAGWRVEALPAADDLPDAPFVADTVIVRGGLAILARPADDGRAAELDGVGEALGGLGLSVVRADPPGTLEGGDVLQTVGVPYGDVVYVGRSGRTSEDAACELPRIASASPLATGIRRVVPVEVRGCRQLTTAMTSLPDGTLIGMPDLVDTSALPGLRVALEPAGAQVLVVGEGHLLLSAAAPRTAAALRGDGFRVTQVDVGEFEAAGGALPALAVLVGSHSS